MLATIIAHTNYVTYILIYIYYIYNNIIIIIAYESLCCSRILLSWVSHGPEHKAQNLPRPSVQSAEVFCGAVLAPGPLQHPKVGIAGNSEYGSLFRIFMLSDY